MNWKCDVLVVGAGPAGSMAARKAAEQGLEVILLERRIQVGTPVRCAEFAPRTIGRYMDLKGPVVCRAISGMDTFWKGSVAAATRVDGLILNRQDFEVRLATYAVRAGARLETGWKAVDLTGNRVIARGPSGKISVSARVIVGADGPLSRIGRAVGAANKYLMPAAQYRMPLLEDSDRTLVFFEPFMVGGYGWVFPKAGCANVGVGVDLSSTAAIRAVLNRFTGDLVSMGLIGSKKLAVTGGYLPVGGLTRCRRDNVILAGDAAGTCHPISGAGIYNALLSGEMAGTAAAEAVLTRSDGPLKTYSAELCSFLGPSLAWAAMKRRRMLRQWDKIDFQTLIRRSWIAFDEFYKGRRT